VRSALPSRLPVVPSCTTDTTGRARGVSPPASVGSEPTVRGGAAVAGAPTAVAPMAFPPGRSWEWPQGLTAWRWPRGRRSGRACHRSGWREGGPVSAWGSWWRGESPGMAAPRLGSRDHLGSGSGAAQLSIPLLPRSKRREIERPDHRRVGQRDLWPTSEFVVYRACGHAQCGSGVWHAHARGNRRSASPPGSHYV
jgi:hypothetical protein